MSRPAFVTIDHAALRHNLHRIKILAPHSKVIAMVKSNAYGHGLTRIAKALPDAEALGVACQEEGMLLRNAGIKNPIMLMEGLFDARELKIAVKNNFILVVHHAAQVSMLENDDSVAPYTVWLKINTGMHRLGFAPEKVADIYKRLLQCANVKKPVGLMTHFAESDSSDLTVTQRQIDIFNSVTAQFKGPRSLANSGGIIAWPEAHVDWVRPGIMLYGVSPFANCTGAEYDLQPVMSFGSRLIAVHDVEKGGRVGYGGIWTADRDMPIGIVAAGYGDGYPRHATNGTPVLVNGSICPLAGRVSMDMLTVDLSSQPDAKPGDPVLLWGKELPVETVAAHCDTSGYELLTRIAQRVRVEEINFNRGKINNAVI